jgi:hypothetical protein
MHNDHDVSVGWDRDYLQFRFSQFLIRLLLGSCKIRHIGSCVRTGKQTNTAAFFADFNIASPSSAVTFCDWPKEVKEAASTNAQIRITFFIGRGHV